MVRRAVAGKALGTQMLCYVVLLFRYLFCMYQLQVVESSTPKPRIQLMCVDNLQLK